jgi:predicted permease
VVVLDHDFWRSAFGADPAVIGRSIELDGTRHRIVGVMPAGFRFPIYSTTELWMPIRADGSFLGLPGHGQYMVARIGGESVERAQARADGVARALEEAQPRDGGWSIHLSSLPAMRARDPQLRQAVYVLLGAVALLLLVAGVNATSLLLVRGWSRARELAVRVALGASRRRVMGQLLTESVVLALLSGFAAALVALAALHAILGIMPESITFFAPYAIRMGWRTLAFTFAVAAAIGVLTGVAPALQARRASSKAGTGLTPYATRTPGRSRLRRSLVVAEVAVSVVLLLGAGLLMHSFIRLVRVDPGFRIKDVAVMQLNLSSTSYPSSAERAAFLHRLEERLEAIPGVEGVAVNSRVPPEGGLAFGVQLTAEAQSPAAGPPQILPFASVPPDFFRVLDVRVIAGRSFTAEDAGTDRVIIDQDLARFLWPDQNPLGRRFRIRPDSPWLTVTGVVGDLRMVGPDDREARFGILYPLERNAAPSYVPLAIRTHGDPRPLLQSFRAAVHELDPRQPIEELRPASEFYAQTIDMPRFLLVLMAILAGLALLLAAVGIYGVLAFGVTQRRGDLGIRMALGASVGRVGWGVLREGLLLTGAGLVLGVAISVSLSRLIRGLLYGVEPGDPITTAAVVFVSLVAAALACWLPARRATRVDPAEVLRAE